VSRRGGKETHIERRLHQAQWPSSQYDPLEVESAHQHRRTAIELAEDVGGGDEGGVENELLRVRRGEEMVSDVLEGRRKGRGGKKRRGTHLARVRPPHAELVQFLRRREAFCPFLDAASVFFVSSRS
jgi:hypothetical protein